MFGVPFGNLNDLTTHRYVDLVFESLRAWRFSYMIHYWPSVERLRGLIIDQSVIANRLEYYGWVAKQTQARVEKGDVQRADFMTEILKHNGVEGKEIKPDEMNVNAVVFLSAGSETTATTLSAVTYLLLQNPEVLQKLKDEVRGKWSKYDEITMADVNNAPYLIAVLQEGLRYFPPVPTGFERRVGKGGAIVSGTSPCYNPFRLW